MLTYLLPSVLDISGTGRKRTVVISKKSLDDKTKTNHCNWTTVIINVTFSSSTIVRNNKRLQHEKSRVL